MRWVRAAMWTSTALIAWTHVGYPAAAALAASRTRRPQPDPDLDPAVLPTVTLVIAAHDEASVIAQRLDNALALDYPADRLEIVLSLDGSTDGTRAIAQAYADRGVRVLDNPRAGKTAAQNAAVAASTAELVAFSDANSMWEPDALRRLAAHFADPEIGYVCGRLALVDPVSGRSVEGVYWRFELWLRAQESRVDSITAGNGAIYAVRRADYVELSAAHSHDIGLPFRLRRAGRRSIYEPAAVATELAAPTSSAEWERKVRMQSRSWNDVLFGGMLAPRGQPAAYVAALLSHRLLRYATGVLHVVVAAAALALAPRSRAARAIVVLHLAWLGLADAGRRSAAPGRLAAFAWYYLVVTGASLAGLVQLLRTGPQATWTAVEGTR